MVGVHLCSLFMEEEQRQKFLSLITDTEWGIKLGKLGVSAKCPHWWRLCNLSSLYPCIHLLFNNRFYATWTTMILGLYWGRVWNFTLSISISHPSFCVSIIPCFLSQIITSKSLAKCTNNHSLKVDAVDYKAGSTASWHLFQWECLQTLLVLYQQLLFWWILCCLTIK